LNNCRKNSKLMKKKRLNLTVGRALFLLSFVARFASLFFLQYFRLKKKRKVVRKSVKMQLRLVVFVVKLEHLPKKQNWLKKKERNEWERKFREERKKLCRKPFWNCFLRMRKKVQEKKEKTMS
jgi:hypothetical protein